MYDAQKPRLLRLSRYLARGCATVNKAEKPPCVAAKRCVAAPKNPKQEVGRYNIAPLRKVWNDFERPLTLPKENTYQAMISAEAIRKLRKHVAKAEDSNKIVHLDKERIVSLMEQSQSSYDTPDTRELDRTIKKSLPKELFMPEDNKCVISVKGKCKRKQHKTTATDGDPPESEEAIKLIKYHNQRAAEMEANRQRKFGRSAVHTVVKELKLPPRVVHALNY